MDAKMRTCVVCGKQYEYCNKCRKYENLPLWMFTFCSERCKSIYNITSNYEDKRISIDEAKEQLNKFDLSDKDSFGDSYKKAITSIINTKNQTKKSTKKSIHEDTKTDDKAVKKDIITDVKKETKSNVE